MALITKETVSTVLHKSSRAVLGRYRVPLVRWMRSQRNLRRVARADVVAVSFAKSGRTWLRVMISRLYQIKYGLPEETLIERDNLHKLNPALPRFLFTHASYTQDIRAIVGAGSPYHGKRLIFLARHPADTAVSYYFHVRNRVNPLTRDVKGLPEDLSDTPMLEFVANPQWGMPAIIEYLNAWADGLQHHPEHLLVRYEDLRRDPRPELRRIAQFIGEEFDPAAFDEAAAFASFERLQQKEREDFFSSGRLRGRDPSQPESFKVRRGKVMGYRDYFNDREVAWIEQQIANHLNPMYGYDDAAPAEPDRWPCTVIQGSQA